MSKMKVKHPINTKTQGVGYVLLSAFCYSLFGIFYREISDSFGPFVQNWTRGIVIVLLFFSIAYFTGRIKRIAKSDLRWFVVAGISIAVTNPLLFVATNNLALGTTLFIFYSAIVFTTYLCGYLLFKEEINAKKIVALGLAILGLLLILSSSLEGFRVKFGVISFLAGAFNALFTVSSKKISKKYSGVFINLVTYLIVILLNGSASLIVRDKVNLDIVSPDWLYNTLFAFLIVVTFLFTVQGFKYLEAQKASLILLSELVFTLIVGFLFYKEIPTITAVIGGIMILIAIGLPLLKLTE